MGRARARLTIHVALREAAPVEYEGPPGEERHTSGRCLDACGAGLILSSGGARTCNAWGALRVVELTE